MCARWCRTIGCEQGLRGAMSKELSVRVSVFGLGYVGSVTAACFSGKGHQVIGIDVAGAKVEAMAAGRAPILEPGIQEIIAESHTNGTLTATTDADEAV